MDWWGCIDVICDFITVCLQGEKARDRDHPVLC